MNGPPTPLFFAVGGVVIERDGEEAEEVAVTVCDRSTGLGDAEGVDGGNSWRWSDPENLLPLETRVAIDLVPSHLVQLLEGLHGRVPVVLFEAQKII